MAKKRNLSSTAAALLKRLDAAPGQTIESGRVGVKQSGGSPGGSVDAMVDRVFSGDMREAKKAQFAAARETAAASRRLAAASHDVAAATSAQPETPGGAVQSLPAGPRILLDYIEEPPHTRRTAKGKVCDTPKWFNKCFLVYDPSIPLGQRGSETHPWLGIAGPKFRCYYPNSSDADFEAIISSGSSGRWLHAWPQKGNYVGF